MLNKKVLSYENSDLRDIQKKLIGDRPEWVIEPDELTFTAQIGKGTSAVVYRGMSSRKDTVLNVVVRT